MNRGDTVQVIDTSSCYSVKFGEHGTVSEIRDGLVHVRFSNGRKQWFTENQVRFIRNRFAQKFLNLSMYGGKTAVIKIGYIDETREYVEIVIDETSLYKDASFDAQLEVAVRCLKLNGDMIVIG